MLLHLSVVVLNFYILSITNLDSQDFAPRNLKPKVWDFDLILVEVQNAEQFYPLDLFLQQIVT